MNAKQIWTALAHLFAYVVAGVTHAVSVALLLLIAWAVAGKYGLKVSAVPQIDGTALAYLCGAWWLYRGRA